MLKTPATAALAACCLLLAACAGTPEPKTSSIETRAQARWDALLAGRLDDAYEFLSPGYRSSVTPLQYQRVVLTRKVEWLKAEYVGSECSESVCNVRIKLDYRIWGAVPGVTKFQNTLEAKENWIRVDGQWWFVPEE